MTEKPVLFKDIFISGLNVENGLARLDYDEESYLRVLRIYYSHIPSFIKTARNSSIENLNEYRIAVHGIKGSSWGIGAEELGDEAEKLENAARDKNMAFIEANTVSFLETAEKFIKDLGIFIKKTDSLPSRMKPEMDEPNPGLLSDALNAAREYDIRALKNTINSLNTHTYRSFPGLADWLLEQADNSNFDNIQEKLEELLSGKENEV